MKWILFFSILTFALNINAKNADPVVAEVNGKKIRKSVLLSYHKQNLNLIQSNRKVTIEASLNDLIDRIIGIDNAKKVNIHKRADVIKKMNDIVYQAYISDELTPRLSNIKVKDSEVKSYYKNYPEYRTSQILLRLRTVPSPEELANALSKANKIYNEVVKNPKSFETLAQQHSQVATAPTGGDMGYQPNVRLSQEYYSAIKGKRIGYVPKPFQTQYGISIVKITGIKSYKQIDTNMYKKIIYDQKRDAILQEYFQAKRTKANIKINKEKLNYD